MILKGSICHIGFINFRYSKKYFRHIGFEVLRIAWLFFPFHQEGAILWHNINLRILILSPRRIHDY